MFRAEGSLLASARSTQNGSGIVSGKKGKRGPHIHWRREGRIYTSRVEGIQAYADRLALLGRRRLERGPDAPGECLGDRL